MPGLRIRPAVESRPPSVSWFDDLVAPPADPAGQPSLLELPGLPDEPAPGRIEGTVPAVGTAVGWQAVPDPRLPDAVSWSSSLALAAVEVVRGRRPIGQLSRWAADDVINRLGRLAKRSPFAKPSRGIRPVLQARVQSARVQFPWPEVAEAAVHIRIGPGSVAVALRLEAGYDRWLATALQLR